MTDQAIIIEAMVRAIRKVNLPRGLLWQYLSDRVIEETRCTKDELNEAILEGIDLGELEEREPGWIRVPDAKLQAQADDRALERHMEDQAERDQQLAREHDYNRQHSAEGR